jgi:GntR family transcriptional regulator, transcriptional repressor for pyruvate dehydrogenase complex
MFEPITDAGIPDSIINQTKRLIAAGLLNPGDRLPGERELMKELKVSRPSLRQALQALESIGYVKTIAGKGTYIQDLSDNAVNLMGSVILPWAEGDEQQLTELLEVRLMLEIETATLAAKRANREDLQGIHSAFDAIVTARANRQLNEMVSANIAFHRSIAQASRNSLLVALTDSIAHAMRDISTFSLRVSGGGSSESVDEHRRIYEAIASRNVDAARAEIENHIAGVAKLLHVYLSNTPKGDHPEVDEMATTA